MGITVRATAIGYYEHLRHIGDVFEIRGDLNEAGDVIAFSKRWMERVAPTPTHTDGKGNSTAV